MMIPLRQETKGLLIMISSAFFFSGMNVLVKVSLRSYPFMETVFFRSFFGLIFVAALIRSRGLPLIGPRPRLLMLRGSLGFIGLSCYYYAMGHLTIADTVILNKVSPVFVMIFAYFFLGERLPPAVFIILGVALIGVYNVIQPQLEFAPMAGAVGLFSAVISGLAYVVVKKLSSDHHAPQIVLAFVGMATVLSLPFLIPVFRWPDPGDWLIFAAIGACSSIGQILMTKAYALGAPTPVSIAGYSVVLVSALFGYLFLGEIQDTRALIGSVIVLVSLMLLPFIRPRPLRPVDRRPMAEV
ncbi:MAG TPA: DMT family transporter [bacterium]|nr:DMT family transporter [bacterium]